MKCECEHENICRFRNQLFDAVSLIIEGNYGGNSSAETNFEYFIKSNCKYRKPLPAEFNDLSSAHCKIFKIRGKDDINNGDVA